MGLVSLATLSYGPNIEEIWSNGGMEFCGILVKVGKIKHNNHNKNNNI